MMNEFMKSHKKLTICLVCGVALIGAGGVSAYNSVNHTNEKISVPNKHNKKDITKSAIKQTVPKVKESKNIVEKAIDQVTEKATDTGKVIQSALESVGLGSVEKAYANVDQDKILKAASIIQKEPELPKNNIAETLNDDKKINEINTGKTPLLPVFPQDPNIDTGENSKPENNGNESNTGNEGNDNNHDNNTGNGGNNNDGNNAGNEGNDNGTGNNTGNEGNDNGSGSDTGNGGGEITPPSKNSMPTISAPMLIVHVNSSLDFVQGATANDEEDGDLTSQIKVVSNDVNLREPGAYHVTLSVTDSNEQTTTVSRLVLVLNARPVISGQNVRVEAGTDFNVMEGIAATDQEDGDLTNSVIPSIKEIDTSKVGETIISYTVVDLNGEAAKEFTRKVTVYSEDAEFDGIDDLTVNIGDKVDLLSGVTAKNKYSDDFKDKITTDIEEVDTTKPCDIVVAYSVTDKFGHTTTVNRTIHIVEKNETNNQEDK